MREANRHCSLNRFITLAPVTAAYLGSGRLVFPSLAFVLPWTACIRLAVQNAPAGVDTVSTLVSASHFTPACPLLLLSIADFTAGLVDYNPDRRLRSEILPWEECVSNGGGREGFPAVWAIAIFWFASTVPLLQSVMIFFPLLMCQWQVFWVFLCSLVWLPNAMPPFVLRSLGSFYLHILFVAIIFRGYHLQQPRVPAWRPRPQARQSAPQPTSTIPALPWACDVSILSCSRANNLFGFGVQVTPQRFCSSRLHFTIAPVCVQETPPTLRAGAFSEFSAACAVNGCPRTPEAT